MKKRSFPRAGFIILVIIVVLLLAAGGWYVARQFQIPEGDVPSTILVYILTPSSGAEVSLGDFVSVSSQVLSPEGIKKSELYIDGQSVGVVTNSPEIAAWSWQAMSQGFHTFVVRAFSVSGSIGVSQEVIVYVRANGEAFQISAEEGQTLVDIGNTYSISPDKMAASNPFFPLLEPLSAGDPVEIPAGTSPESSGGLPPLADLGDVIDSTKFTIDWVFSPLKQVDKSYCYSYSGQGVWNKIPVDPFEFFSGDEISYSQIYKGQSEPIVLQIQCWGWLGGVLEYLGQGETVFDVAKQQGPVTISAEDFVLQGTTKVLTETGGPIQVLPPPFSLREPESAAECSSHGHPLIAPFICDTLMKKPVKDHVILVWEWTPKFCWPGDCPWTNDIAGYYIFSIDPVTKDETYLKEIANPSNKVVAVPLIWGSPCYGVRAYSDDPAFESSDMATYCPGDTTETEEIILTPSEWITTGGTWFDEGDCDTYGGADAYLTWYDDGFGKLPGQVLVGSSVVDDDEEDCSRSGSYSAGVLFELTGKLSTEDVIQKAELLFQRQFIEYGATAVAAPTPYSCVSAVGRAKKTWGLLGGEDHFVNDDILGMTDYFLPITSLSAYAIPKVDVTSAVKYWMQHPEKNHGFLLTPVLAPQPAEDGSGSCYSGLGLFQLKITTFKP